MDELDLELDAAVKKLGFESIKDFASAMLDHELNTEMDVERLRMWAKALKQIHDYKQGKKDEEIRQLRAGLKDMEIRADTWKDMYTMAQNANSLRQDALEQGGF